MTEEKIELSLTHPSKVYLRYFQYEHLPEQLAEISKPFCEMAYQLVEKATEQNAEVSQTMEGLQKLLEAKDCAVRAFL